MEKTVDGAIQARDFTEFDRASARELKIINDANLAGCVALVVSWIAMLAMTGFGVFGSTVPDVFKASIGIVWATWLGLVALGAVIRWVAIRGSRKTVASRWPSFFDGRQLRTLAGEDVRFVSSSLDGGTLQVRFWDGQNATVPLSMLTDYSGTPHYGRDSRESASDGLLRRVSANGWENPEGWGGVVRSIVSYSSGADPKLMLKFPDGMLREYALSDLVPRKITKDMTRIEKRYGASDWDEAGKAVAYVGWGVLSLFLRATG